MSNVDETIRRALEWATPENVCTFPRTAIAHMQGMAALLQGKAPQVAQEDERAAGWREGYKTATAEYEIELEDMRLKLQDALSRQPIAWPNDWPDQLKNEYAQGLKDGQAVAKGAK